jgi:hypothetical protein
MAKRKRRKRRPSSPRRASEVSSRGGGEGPLSGHGVVSLFGGLAPRVLCLAASSAVGARAGRSSPGGRSGGGACGEPTDVRESASPSRAPRAGPARFAQACGAVMREQGRRGQHRRRFVRTTDSQHAFPVANNVVNQAFYVPTPNTIWAGDIMYLATPRGLAVSGGSPRPLLPSRDRLGDRRPQPLVQTPFDELNAEVSPDGRSRPGQRAVAHGFSNRPRPSRLAP